MELPPSPGVTLREQLSGCATRRGFPDVAWEEFFQPVSVSREEAEELMQQLGGSAPAGVRGAKA